MTDNLSICTFLMQYGHMEKIFWPTLPQNSSFYIPYNYTIHPIVSVRKLSHFLTPPSPYKTPIFSKLQKFLAPPY